MHRGRAKRVRKDRNRLGCGPFCAAGGGKKCCGSNIGPPQGGKNSRRRRRKKPRSGKNSREAEKDLIGLERKCCLGGLIRGLQNLETSLKGFNCCGAKLSLQCADSRFAKPRGFLRGRTGCHFLHRAKSNQKARGAKPCDLRFKSPLDSWFSLK